MQSLTGGNGVGEFAASEYNLSNGKVSWGTDDAENITGITDLVVATFVIPANSLADEYELGVTGITLSKDYGENWENSASASTILTITDSSSGGESGGTTTSSDYEIWYELDETAPDTENNNAGDNYKEYDISTDAGKKVTATLYIKNTGTAPVSLQAYDIYLTHDSKLTAGQFSAQEIGTNAKVGTTTTDIAGGKQTRIQAIGQSTGSADINIDLPAAGGTDNAVALGTITFTIEDSAIYNTPMKITLTPGSAADGENSTNIGIADYITVDGTTETTGNKESKYPSVGGTTKGAEVMTTYDVTYDANEGAGAPATQKKQHNNSLTLSTTVPTRDNYSFTGWNTMKDGSGTAYAAGVPYSKNEAVTLYAQWQQETVTVTWMNGNDVYQTDTLNSGTAATTPATNPTKAADTQYTYTFSHWSASENGPKIETYPTLTEDTKYYAVYNKTLNQYTVTWYDDNGSQLRKDTVEYGETPSYGSDPTKADSSDGQFSYTFAGWAATQGGNVIQPLPTVDGNEEYYAVFTPVIKTYTVNYDAGAGEFATGATTEVDVEFGKTPETIPTPTAPAGYYFSGWSDGKTTYKTDLSDFAVSGEVTLTAQYTATTYTITLVPAGGNIPNMQIGANGNYTMSYAINGDNTLPTASKIGYAFDGWKLASGVYGWDADTYGANTSLNGKWGDVTLVAQWSENAHEVVQSESVQNGSAQPNVNSAKEGDVVTVTITPKEGYKFGEDDTVTYTYTDENGLQTKTIPVTDEDDDGIFTGSFEMPNYPVEITATFTAIDYTINVTVEPAGYATVTPSKATANIKDEITLTASNIKDGYQLAGYQVINASTNEEITETDGKFTMPAANVTVTATFEGKSYTIEYDSNDGENTMVATNGTFGTVTTLSENAFTRTGYKFEGWTTTVGGTTVEYVDKASFNPETYAESYKLYAVWTADEVNYTVNYWLQNIGGGAEHNSNNFTKQDNDTVTREATADSVISVVPAKDYTGFTTPDAQANVTIKPDGTTVVDFYYTRNSYTITFKDGETTLNNLTITKQYGDAVAAPSGPSKNGYTFKAWNPAVPATMPAANTTISATWDLVTYNITYMDGDKVLTELTPATYTIESKDKLPSYSKTNYIFNGWKVTSGANEKWAENAVINAGSDVENRYGHVTLTADWTEAITYVVEDYKYAADGYKMLRIPYKQTDDNVELEYKFDTASMYYMPATVSDKYLLNPTDTGVFYYLIESKYVGTDNKLTEDGMKLISTGTVTDRATITYDGKINDDTIVNIADANIVYQMIVNGGGYYTGTNDLSIEQRLRADMNKESYNSSVARATIEDVAAIMAIINGTTTTNP